jgi:hypothetical protein
VPRNWITNACTRVSPNLLSRTSTNHGNGEERERIFLELLNRSLELALSLDWGSNQRSERGEDESFSSLECYWEYEQKRRMSEGGRREGVEKGLNPLQPTSLSAHAARPATVTVTSFSTSNGQPYSSKRQQGGSQRWSNGIQKQIGANNTSPTPTAMRACAPSQPMEWRQRERRQQQARLSQSTCKGSQCQGDNASAFSLSRSQN